jgi:hypothetical protein
VNPRPTAGTTKVLSPWPVSSRPWPSPSLVELPTRFPSPALPEMARNFSLFHWNTHMTLQNAKHEKFAVAFVANGNAAEAARAIGYLNYSAQRGSDLLRRPEIATRVEELMRDRPSLPTRLAHRLDAETLARAAQAVAFLASLA